MLKRQHVGRSAIAAAALLLTLVAAQAAPQDPAFEVVSVKPNNSGAALSTTNVPLGPGSVFTPTGGYLSIVNYPAMAFISFAYKITGDQEQYLRAHVPGWVLSDRFDIQARAAGNPNKDEMRLMMRSLLADRFHLVIRHETRQTPVFALLLVKPGKTGPELRHHPEDAPCVTTSSNDMAALCGGLVPLPHGPGQISKFGARNVTMTFIANQLSIMGQLGRPVVDLTGLTGNFDFSLEWSPDSTAPQIGTPEVLPGPPFAQALREQLGLKLSAETGPADFLLVDRIERPTGN